MDVFSLCKVPPPLSMAAVPTAHRPYQHVGAGGTAGSTHTPGQQQPPSMNTPGVMVLSRLSRVPQWLGGTDRAYNVSIPLLHPLHSVCDAQATMEAVYFRNTMQSTQATAPSGFRSRKELLSAITSHAEKFTAYHAAKKGMLSRISRAVSIKFADAIKEREREEEKLERARITALRSSDLNAYAMLLQQTKNERLTFLLQQTESFLVKLSEAVKSQQSSTASGPKAPRNKAVVTTATEEPAPATEGDTGPTASPVTREQEEDVSDFGDIPSDEEQAANAHGDGYVAQRSEASRIEEYYKIAHRKTEKITEQPRTITGGQLTHYQLAGLEWLVSLYNNHLNGILADEMGLGKTVQTISLFAYLIERKNNHGPFMVTVPLSTMSNWANEFARWAPSIQVVQYRGAPLERKEIMREQMAPGTFNVLLTTYDYAMKDRSALKKTHWQYIVVDEGHRLKNAHCKFTQVLGQEYISRNRLLLTGTPLQNNLPELWSLLNFLLPQVFSSVDSFEQWFSKPFASFKGGSGRPSHTHTQDAAEASSMALSTEEKLLVINRLHQVLRPFLLRRLKSQVLTQLPEKVERVIRCDLSAWQRAQYTQIQRYGAVATDPGKAAEGANTMRGLNGALVQLRKVCNHPFLFVDAYDIDDMLWRSSGKFDLLDRMLPKLHQTGHRVLIFSQMTSLMDVLEMFLTYRGLQYLRLDGSTSAENRAERMKLFNAPDSPYFAFLLSTRAGGLGINLTSADTVILFDTDWNPTADAQAQDRAHRIGQTREVRVFRLITATPLEERILARANDKANMETLVIEAGQFSSHDPLAPTDATNDDSMVDKRKFMEDILTAELENGRNAEENEESAIPDDEAINEMLARSESELQTFTKMDADRAATERLIYPCKEGVNANDETVPVYSRLLRDEELPKWVLSIPANAKPLLSVKSKFADDGAIATGTSTAANAAAGDGAATSTAGRKRRQRPEVEAEVVDDSAAHIAGGKSMRKRKNRVVYYDDDNDDDDEDDDNLSDEGGDNEEEDEDDGDINGHDEAVDDVSRGKGNKKGRRKTTAEKSQPPPRKRGRTSRKGNDSAVTPSVAADADPVRDSESRPARKLVLRLNKGPAKTPSTAAAPTPEPSVTPSAEVGASDKLGSNGDAGSYDGNGEEDDDDDGQSAVLLGEDDDL